MNIEEKIRRFPASPGVYIMRDAGGEIIYIGKARSLRQRVRQYFGASVDARYQVKFLVAKVADIDVMLTDTEKEALLLENTLIKQHRPRYNLNLKDDKTYFSLRIDPREQFPRFTIIRKILARIPPPQRPKRSYANCSACSRCVTIRWRVACPATAPAFITRSASAVPLAKA
jgi:excinuclease UvrABC nuclease subunit